MKCLCVFECVVSLLIRLRPDQTGHVNLSLQLQNLATESCLGACNNFVGESGSCSAVRSPSPLTWSSDSCLRISAFFITWKRDLQWAATRVLLVAHTRAGPSHTQDLRGRLVYGGVIRGCRQVYGLGVRAELRGHHKPWNSPSPELFTLQPCCFNTGLCAAYIKSALWILEKNGLGGKFFKPEAEWTAIWECLSNWICIRRWRFYFIPYVNCCSNAEQRCSQAALQTHSKTAARQAPCSAGRGTWGRSGSFPVAREAVGSAPEDRSPLAVLCCFVWKSSVGLFPLRGMCFACLLVPLQ